MTVATGTARGSRFEFRMSPRDLINVGGFGALYVVVVFMINMLGFINPAVMLVALAASIVAGGIVFMLFLTRVHHAGVVFVFAVITGGLFLLTGHPPIGFALNLAVALIAEVLLRFGGYRSRWMGVAAYTVYATWYAGQLLPLLYAREEYLSSPAMKQMGPHYLEQMDSLLSPTVLIAFDISTAFFGLLGGLLGVRLLRKHFEKAGLA